MRPTGAVLLNLAGRVWRLYSFSPFPSIDAGFEISTHCGDVFSAALALGSSLSRDWSACITFANALAALQHPQPPYRKVGLPDIVEPAAIARIRD